LNSSNLTKVYQLVRLQVKSQTKQEALK
jgi:hypothetical protein